MLFFYRITLKINGLSSSIKYGTMKRTIPLIIIAASLILMLINFSMSDERNLSFWASIISNILVTVAMIATLKANKKNIDHEN